MVYNRTPFFGDKRVEQFRGTTILSVRRNNTVVIGGDGQVTMGNTIMKGNACKVRRLYNDRVIAGFAGGTADAFTLFELFEGKLEEHSGQLTRAAVELAKDWRTNKMLRNLEACTGNDALMSESDVRRTSRTHPIFIAGSDFVCSGFGSIQKYDNMFGPSLACSCAS